METVRGRQGKDSGHVSLSHWAQNWAAPYWGFSEVLSNCLGVLTPVGSGHFPLGGDFHSESAYP